MKLNDAAYFWTSDEKIVILDKEESENE